MTGKIKLNAASGGGSVSFQAPSSTGDDRIITLPTSADGTVLTTTNPKAGNILQVVQAVKTDGATISVAQGAQTDATTAGVGNMNPQLTCASSTNKVLILADINVGVNMTGQLYMTLTVDGSVTTFRGDADGNRQRSSSVTRPAHGSANQNITATFLYSPSDTNQHTYGVAFGHANDATQTIRINTQSASNHNYNNTAASSITLMEVAG